MKTENLTLLVIDVQLVAFDGKITPPISDGSKLLATLSSLTALCRSTGVPVTYAQTSAFPGMPYARDTHGWEIHPDVAPHEGERVFQKAGPSAFENPDLHAYLQALCITDLLVCGIWSEGCVVLTAEAGLELGYQVALVGDGHSTVRDTAAEAQAVVAQMNERLAGRGGTVLATSEVEDLLGAC